jgi:hypothetical protein
MPDIVLVLDESEQHVVEAAFSEYRALLLRADAAGGDGAATAQVMGPIFGRVDRRFHEQMYGLAEPEPPEWLHEQHDGMTAAKARADAELALGDHHVGVGL